MARIVVAVATFALGAHAIAAPVLGAENYDGTYTGKQMLTKGSNAEACLTEEEDVSLIIRGEVLRFTNSRRHDFHRFRSPDRIVAAGEGTFWSIQGRMIGDTIEVDVDDSTCGYHWHLKRTGPP